MIKAAFLRDESGSIASFNITGHADAGPYGSDIVCAAVSVLAISTINGIESLAGFEPTVISDDENGGLLDFSFGQAVTGEQFHIAEILLENLLLALQSVAAEHHEYVTVQTNQISK